MSQNGIEHKNEYWHIDFMMTWNIWASAGKKKRNMNYYAVGLAALTTVLASTAHASISYQISPAGSGTENVTFDRASHHDILAGGIGITSTGAIINGSGAHYGLNLSGVAGNLTASFIDGLINPASGSHVAPPVGLLVPSPEATMNGNNPNDTPQQEVLPDSRRRPTPVPEASTIITGALLLLSFGVCSLKSFGKSRV